MNFKDVILNLISLTNFPKFCIKAFPKNFQNNFKVFKLLFFSL